MPLWDMELIVFTFHFSQKRWDPAPTKRSLKNLLIQTQAHSQLWYQVVQRLRLHLCQQRFLEVLMFQVHTVLQYLVERRPLEEQLCPAQVELII